MNFSPVSFVIILIVVGSLASFLFGIIGAYVFLKDWEKAKSTRLVNSIFEELQGQLKTQSKIIETLENRVMVLEGLLESTTEEKDTIIKKQRSRIAELLQPGQGL